MDSMNDNKHTMSDLYQMQSLPLNAKIQMTKRRIDEWVDKFGEDGCYVGFSAGKDSTVLADIIRNICGYKEIPLVFIDVPTQYPELKQFAQTFDNLVILKPQISFAEVVKKYGFPLFSKETSECIASSKRYIKILTDRQTLHFAYRIADLIGIDRRKGSNKLYEDLKRGNIPSEIIKSPVRFRQLLGIKSDDFGNKYDKSRYLFMLDAPFDVSNQCCSVMKKQPAKKYHKETGRVPITAQMAHESLLRTSQWIKNGCNGFNMKIPTSNPMSFWTENDVLYYIKQNNLPICPVYGEVVIDYESMGRCEKQISMGEYGLIEEVPILKTTGCHRTGCVLCGFGCHLEKESRFERLKETHPKFHNLLFKLKNNGVSYAEALDWVNKHGGFNIKY